MRLDYKYFPEGKYLRDYLEQNIFKGKSNLYGKIRLRNEYFIIGVEKLEITFLRNV